MIPSSQLLHRDPKTIGNRNQRVATMHHIPLRTRARHSARNGNDKLISCVHAIIHFQSVCPRDITRMSMHSSRDTIQCLAATDNMKAPNGALVLGNLFDPRCKDIERADRDVQVE
jgi:hypothetical protein